MYARPGNHNNTAPISLIRVISVLLPHLGLRTDNRDQIDLPIFGMSHVKNSR